MNRNLAQFLYGAMVGLVAATPVQAAALDWTGGGADTKFSTNTNWLGSSAPSGTDVLLRFNPAQLAPSGWTTATSNIPGPSSAGLFSGIQFDGGGFTLDGSEIFISGGGFSPTITNTAGSNLISAPVSFAATGNGIPVTATVSVSGGSLTFDHLFTPAQNLEFLASGSGSLILSGNLGGVALGTSTSTPLDVNRHVRFIATGSSSIDIGADVEALDLRLVNVGTTSSINVTAGLRADKLDVSSGDIVLNGENGAIMARGTSLPTPEVSISSGGQLTLDNTSNANTDRVADGATVNLGKNGVGALVFKGNTSVDVDEVMGGLSMGSGSTLRVESNGKATGMTFDSLASPTTFIVRNFEGTGGTLGGGGVADPTIRFTSAPTLPDGLIGGGIVNGTQWATYNIANGVKAATTTITLNGAGPTDNVYVNGVSQILSANTTINSLAINGAGITGNNTLTVSSGQLLSTGASGTNTLAPKVVLTGASGIGNYIHANVDTVFSGGIDADGNLNIKTGNGSVTISGSSSVSGSLFANTLALTGPNNLFSGGVPTIVSAGTLDIGTTEQTLDIVSINSLTGGSNGLLNVNGGSVNFLSDVDLTSTGNLSLVNAAASTQVTATAGKVSAYGTIDGSITAQDIELFGGVIANGGLSATGTIFTKSGSLTSPTTVAGTITSATLLDVGGSTLFSAANTYTGQTQIGLADESAVSTLTLSGNGAIASSSAIAIGQNDSLALDGLSTSNTQVNRIGNTVGVSMADAALLELAGAGGPDERIGVLSIGAVGSPAEATVRVSGTNAVLRSSSLSVDPDSALFVHLGSSGKLFFDDNAGVTGSAPIQNTFVRKIVGAGTLPMWATYNSTDGVTEVTGVTKSLTTGVSGEYVRVNDATNADLGTSATMAGVIVDTIQAMTGSSILTTGGVVFFKDNQVDITSIDFGASQGQLINAGANTINSVIQGAGGLRKLGDGTLTLAAANTYTGPTRVSGGELVLASSAADLGGDVVVDTGATLNGAHLISGSLISDGTLLLASGTANLLAVTGDAVLGGAVQADLTGGQSKVLDVTGNLMLNTPKLTLDNIGAVSGNTEFALFQFGGSLSGSANFLSITGLDSSKSASVVLTAANEVRIKVSDAPLPDTPSTVFDLSPSNPPASTVTWIGGSSSWDTSSNWDSAQIPDNSQAAEVIASASTGDIVVAGPVASSTVNSLTVAGTNATAQLNLQATGDLIATNSVTIDGGGIVDLGGATLAGTAITVNADGSIVGEGTIDGNVFLRGGSIAPGNSPGEIHITGDLNQDATSQLILEIAGTGASEFDQLIIGGDLIFDPNTSVTLSFLNGFTPQQGDSFDFFSLIGLTGEIIGLNNVDFLVTGLQEDISAFDASFASGTFSLTANVATSAVPLPGAVWLFGSGLLGLVGMARRKKAA